MSKRSWCIGQRDAADMVQAAGHAGDRLEFLVEPDRVALQRRHVGVAVQRVKAARGVPGRPGGQVRPFDQHHIRPAKLGQVIQHRTADDAAADHEHSGMGFHAGLLDRRAASPRGGDGRTGLYFAQTTSRTDALYAVGDKFCRFGPSAAREFWPCNLGSTGRKRLAEQMSGHVRRARSVPWRSDGSVSCCCSRWS